MLLKFQSEKKKHRDEEGAKASVPDKAAGDVNEIRIERPNPARCDSHAATKTALSNLENGETRKGGEQRVQAQDDEGGSLAENAEEFEDSSKQVRIDRSHPGGGAGLHEQRIAIAMSFGDGASDATGLEAKPQMILILVPCAVIEKTDGHEAQSQSDERNCRRRLPNMLFFHGGGGQGAHDFCDGHPGIVKRPGGGILLQLNGGLGALFSSNGVLREQ